MGERDGHHANVSGLKGDATLPLQARFKSSSIGIGELARRVGVSASTVRYYEAEGLLPNAARRSGKRIYGADDIARLKILAMARRLGLPISELRGLAGLNAEDQRGAARAQAASMRALAETMLESAETLDRLADCNCVDSMNCRLLDTKS